MSEVDIENGLANAEIRHATSYRRLFVITTGIVLLLASVFAIGVTFGEALARNSAVESHGNIVAPDGSGAGSVARARRRASDDFSAEAVATAANQASAIDEKAKQASLDAKAIALQQWSAKQVRSNPWHFPTA
jgi:hypothetical protein